MSGVMVSTALQRKDAISPINKVWGSGAPSKSAFHYSFFPSPLRLRIKTFYLHHNDLLIGLLVSCLLPIQCIIHIAATVILPKYECGPAICQNAKAQASL